jgi:hypothetical protein
MKPGVKVKGSKIMDGFNEKKIYEMTPEEKLEQKRRRERISKRNYRAKKKAKEERAARMAQGLPEEDRPEDDYKSAYQMLQDMRWVYKNVNGRKRLKDLVEDDDKQFVSMVKELMKIESALLAARARKNEDVGGQGQQNVFVILKGLEDEQKYLPAGESDKTVDMRQVERATNPEYQDLGEEDEESRSDPPEMILKTVDREA